MSFALFTSTTASEAVTQRVDRIEHRFADLDSTLKEGFASVAKAIEKGNQPRKNGDKPNVIKALYRQVDSLYDLAVREACLPFNDDFFLGDSAAKEESHRSTQREEARAKHLLSMALFLPSLRTRTRVTGYFILLGVIQSDQVPAAKLEAFVRSDVNNVGPLYVVKEFLDQFDNLYPALDELNYQCEKVIKWVEGKKAASQ